MISVIIPTYNEEAFISRCLESLLNQTLPRKEYEIIVSDGSSKDNTVKIAKECADKVVIGEAKGAGYGRNFGARYVKGELLAFIDGDTVASKTWLEGVQESLSNAIASTGPIKALEKGSLINSLFYDKWWSFQSLLSLKLKHPIIPGFNFGVRKEFFEKAGKFDDKNIVEDMRLSLKLNKLGKIVYNRKMLVYTSTRRARKTGIIRCILEAWKFRLFKRSIEWREYRNL